MRLLVLLSNMCKILSRVVVIVGLGHCTQAAANYQTMVVEYRSVMDKLL